MSKHTEEPWSVWTSNSHIRISARGDGDVVSATIARDGKPVLSISLEDAERIVSCVNACAGLTTENLESFAGPLILASSVSQWLRYCDLKEQRADLLEALKAFMSLDETFTTACRKHIEEDANEGGMMAKAVLLARDAIARVEAA